jgi:dipeptidase E
MCGPSSVRGFVAAAHLQHFSDLGWASLGALELTALPMVDRARRISWVHNAAGSSSTAVTRLCDWMPGSGRAHLLPSLTGAVWVGVGAGSMVFTPWIGDYLGRVAIGAERPDAGRRRLHDLPYLDVFPTNTLAHTQRWHADIGGGRAYVMDDQTAITVGVDIIEVVTERTWTKLV